MSYRSSLLRRDHKAKPDMDGVTVHDVTLLIICYPRSIQCRLVVVVVRPEYFKQTSLVVSRSSHRRESDKVFVIDPIKRGVSAVRKLKLDYRLRVE